MVFEASSELGGISKTVVYKGNRLDIGGHRFFSKSDRVMDWWTSILPVAPMTCGETVTLRYRGATRRLHSPTLLLAEPEPDPNQVMLVRSRLSRIFHLRKFFNYPIQLDLETLRKLGLRRSLRIGLSYLWARAFPLPEKNLEIFFINRFGAELYRTFFRDYTEKVWGVPCRDIAPDWGSQRVKSLSISAALRHAWRRIWTGQQKSLCQKDTQTSLVEYFLYPKFGPGQMWETVARKVQESGGQVITRHSVTRLHVRNRRLEAVTVKNLLNNQESRVEADYFISTMPIRELVHALEGVHVPDEVRRIADGLPFRDFITVGLLLRRLATGERLPDNWIYIQEPDVKVGRVQIFNNWSPYMVEDPETIWMGLEYFVNEGDELWSLPDKKLQELGVAELVKLGLIHGDDVLDGTVLRVKKTYPAYFGTYGQFQVVRQFLDSFENLFLVGRNGMHRYNNQDHSMLTAMTTVENIRDGKTDKDNIWAINIEDDYHEEG